MAVSKKLEDFRRDWVLVDIDRDGYLSTYPIVGGMVSLLLSPTRMPTTNTHEIMHQAKRMTYAHMH